MQLDSTLPTRIVKVDRDNFGDRYFSGFDVNHETFFADEALNRKLLEEDFTNIEKLFLKTRYLVTGTILLSSSTSADSVDYLINLATKFDIKIIVDLNWREVFWDFSTFGSQKTKQERLKLINRFLNCAHLLKLAKEEAILFFENDDPCEISKTMRNRPDVIVTDGGNPIKWFINGDQGTTSVFNSSKIIDTTGAGDAFLAGLISQLIFCDNFSQKLDIQKCIRFAIVCGLLTCLGEGAIEHQPDYEKVKEFLGSQIL